MYPELPCERDNDGFRLCGRQVTRPDSIVDASFAYSPTSRIGAQDT